MIILCSNQLDLRVRGRISLNSISINPGVEQLNDDGMSTSKMFMKRKCYFVSYRGQYGISSEVKQSLTLQDSVKINNRYFSKDGG